MKLDWENYISPNARDQWYNTHDSEEIAEIKSFIRGYLYGWWHPKQIIITDKPETIIVFARTRVYQALYEIETRNGSQAPPLGIVMEFMSQILVEEWGLKTDSSL